MSNNTNITVNELKRLITEQTPVELIDVRSPQEYANGHIENTNNIPLEEVAPLFDDPDNAKAMIFICESGIRSAQAANFGLLAGLPDVKSLEGGMIQWKTLSSSDDG